MKVTRTLVKEILDVDYNLLSHGAVDMTKKLILDCLGCAVAGSSSLGIKELDELIEEWGGKQESTIVAFGGRFPSPNAALVNGTMGRALDFDDCHDRAVLHPAVPVCFAGFAVGERRGVVGGKEFIPAVALGIDLSCRMAAASPTGMLQGYGWDYSCIYGYFGATATSAKILGLDEDKLLNAMGIAYHQASGTNCGPVGWGHSTKAMGSGFAARGGVVSALMAAKGITGVKEPLAGEMGLYNLFLRGSYTPEYLTEGLGQTFMVEDDSIKPYPCCRCIHVLIDATLALMKENNIVPQYVEEVTAYVGYSAYRAMCEPLNLEETQNPPNSIAAQMSIPWSLANAIIHRKVGIEHFTEEALKNQDVRQLAGKIAVQLDRELTRREIEPGVVEIKSGGRVYSKRVEHVLGSPEKPMSMEDVAKKFRDCASYANKPIPNGKINQVVQMVEKLEDVVDVCEVIRLLG